MSGRPSVSIALATYNGAAFLPAQLRSLAAQTVQPVELVVGDDRSSDNTVAIIEEFARMAPFPVRLTVNNHKLGYKRNFMATAHRCIGETIAFCDQDDLWSPEKLAIVAQAMADPAIVLSFHDYDLIDAQERKIHAHHSQAALLDPQSAGAALGLTQTFRRSLLAYSTLFQSSRDENHPDQVMAHDQWIHFLARCAGIIRHIPESLLDYRQHGANVCGQAPRNLDIERRLSDNPAVLKSYLRGDPRAYEQKRGLLRADLDWQRFSLAHRIELIKQLAPLLFDDGQSVQLRSVYEARLCFIDNRLTLYHGLRWTDRLRAFAVMIYGDLCRGLLRNRLKARLLDLTYGAARPH